MDDAQLQTIWQQRQESMRLTPLAEPLGRLMKHHLGRRVRQFSQLAGAWDEVIPVELRDHTAIEGFHRGVVTVAVDSAARRYQLNTLLRGGLLKALREQCGGAIQRVRLVPGKVFQVDAETGQKRYEI